MYKKFAFALLCMLALVLIIITISFADVTMAQTTGQDAIPTPLPPDVHPYADPYMQGWQGSHPGSDMGTDGGRIQGDACGYMGNNGGMHNNYGMHNTWGMHGATYDYDGCRWDGQHHSGMMSGHHFGNNAAALQVTIPPTTTAPVSYKADIQPIFNARCVKCHGGIEGLYLDNYANVLRGSMHGPIILPGNPANSRLIQYVSAGYMPSGGPPLTQSEIQMLVNWVAIGAPEN